MFGVDRSTLVKQLREFKGSKLDSDKTGDFSLGVGAAHIALLSKYTEQSLR